MNKIYQTAMTALLAVFSFIMMSMPASAHTGHDHAANESMLIHVLFYGASTFVAIVCVWFAYAHLSKQK